MKSRLFVFLTSVGVAVTAGAACVLQTGGLDDGAGGATAITGVGGVQAGPTSTSGSASVNPTGSSTGSGGTSTGSSSPSGTSSGTTTTSGASATSSGTASTTSTTSTTTSSGGAGGASSSSSTSSTTSSASSTSSSSGSVCAMTCTEPCFSCDLVPGVCTPLPAGEQGGCNNQACNANQVCVDGAANGSQCVATTCAAGSCNYHFPWWYCQGGAAQGQPCLQNADCASYNCSSGKCE